MHFEYWTEGIYFVFIMLFLISIPCISVAIIGYRMITKLGRYPSKTPEIQMSIFIKLVVIELISFGFIYTFCRFFATD